MAIFRAAAVSLMLASIVVAFFLLIAELRRDPTPNDGPPVSEAPRDADRPSSVFDPPRVPALDPTPTATPLFGVSPEPAPAPAAAPPSG